MAVFVLVGGWPGSGKSTLAEALAPELRLPLLVKDEIKETLADALGRPRTVEESQRLGRVAVLTLLRVAQRCPGAVLDSTWFDYTRPLLAALPGRLVEVRCIVPIELWGRPVLPLGVGPLLEMDTSGRVDVPALARRITAAAITD